MTLKKRLLELIAQAEATGGQLIEKPDRTEIDCQSISGDLISAAVSIDAECKATAQPFSLHFRTVSSRTISAQDVAAAEIAGREITIVIMKKVAAASAIFLTPSGFAKNLENAEFVSRIKNIECFGEFDPFATYSFVVRPFAGSFDPQIEPWAGQDNALAVVKDHTGSLAPKNLLPWLLSAKPAAPSSVFNLWAAASARRLALAIPTEITMRDGAHIISFKGQRTVECGLAAPQANDLAGIFPVVHEAVTWIYAVKAEAPAKHVLLANQLSLELRQEHIWPSDVGGVLTSALKSAEEAYKLHLLDKSKDVLKSLSDLRKALSDELAQSNKNMQQVASNLWRDFAVSASVIGLRYVTSSIPTEAVSWIAALGAVFLFMSLFITLYGNWRYECIARESRASWQAKIYGFMDGKEFTKLVESPISNISSAYRTVASVISIVYISIIAYFVFLSSQLWLVALEKIWVVYAFIMTSAAELMIRHLG